MKYFIKGILKIAGVAALVAPVVYFNTFFMWLSLIVGTIAMCILVYEIGKQKIF